MRIGVVRFSSGIRRASKNAYAGGPFGTGPYIAVKPRSRFGFTSNPFRNTIGVPFTSYISPRASPCTVASASSPTSGRCSRRMMTSSP